jgi:ankyrin repeat protein
MRALSFLSGVGPCLIFASALLEPSCVHSAPPPPAPRAELNADLLKATRDGDRSTVKALLQRGADVTARDEDRATALMHAAGDADLPVMKLLLGEGADVNATSKSGATALVWALHDVEKVKLLLNHGARDMDAALLDAADIPGATPVLKLLVEHGANLNYSKSGFTVLMAASRAGNLNAVRYLIDHGADVRARTKSGYTALFAALSWPGNAAVVQTLLEHSADANAEVATSTPAHDLYTPVLLAALHGDAGSLERLLAKGGNLNRQGGDFGRTPLIAAATTGSEATVRLLLRAGADVNVKDALGNSPLQWARRRGETSIVRLLEQASTRPRPRPLETLKPAPLRTAPDNFPDKSSVERALARSLPLLQESAQTFTARRACVSCHHQSLVAMTVGLARKQGFVVNDSLADRERSAVLDTLAKSREAIRRGGGVTDDLIPAYALAGLAAEGQEPNSLTDALVHYLVLKQRTDGSWTTPVYRPPQDASEFTFTALAVHGLSVFAPKGRAREVEDRIGRARAWLLQAVPEETEDKAFLLLGLKWANADRAAVQHAARRLLGEQRADGGWGQLTTLPSDAYAAGQALIALHDGAGLSPRAPAYARGVHYLLQTQLADGSWFVPSRSFPVQPYFSTGFPHGRSQFISVSATSWATMALASTSSGLGSR